MAPRKSKAKGPIEQFSASVERSLLLEALIDQAWLGLENNDTAAVKVPRGLCGIALDHGRAVRVLLPRVPVSAVALLRTQYESVVRAVWARHAARPSELGRLVAPLTPESQQTAKKLPGVPEMLAAIERSGPAGAAALLGRARTRLWDAMNSFIHGGIHPYQRGQEGYPAQMLIDVLKNTNALSILTLLVLAELANDAAVLRVIGTLHEEFQDVLPALEAFER